MTVQVSDVLRATAEMNYEDEAAIQNVYHFKNIGGVITDTQAIADVVEILIAVNAAIAALIAALQVIDGVRIINKTQSTDVGYGTFPDTTPFTGTGLVLAKQVALGINFATSRLNVFGRKFFGAVVTGQVLDGGAVATAALTALGNTGAYLAADLAVTNSTWQAGVVATLDSAFLPFQAYTLPTSAITQRRRRSGVGI